MPLVRLEPAAPLSRVKQSTTEPLRSHPKFNFSTKTFVCTQKNRLSEMILLSTQNMLELMGKKNVQFYSEIFVYLNLWTTIVPLNSLSPGVVS